MSRSTLLVVVSSLVAEGTPVLALEMCRYWRRQGLRPELAVLSRDRADLLREVEDAGFDPHFYNLQGRRTRYLSMARQSAELVRTTGASAVLSFPLGWHSFIALGARWANAERVVAHVGNYPPHWTGLAFEKFRFLIQVGRPVTDRLICCSDYVREGVIRHFGVPERDAVTVYNGAPVEEVARRAESARRSRMAGAFRVGMVARLEVHKDQPTIIRAVAALKREGLDVELWLVGDGSRRAEYAALIRSEGVEDRVSLLGTRRDVPELLGQLDAFVFSAKRDEGFGVALVEAMAGGAPIIATNVGACAEVLQDGALGLLVPEKNVAALARAIRELKADPRVRVRTEAAKKRVAQFTIGQMADRYAELLGL